MKKKGTGFLIWGGFLLLYALYPLFVLEPIQQYESISLNDLAGRRLSISGSVEMKLLTVAGGIISLALCYLFYRIAQKHEQRKPFAKIPGYFFCVFGTASPYYGMAEIAKTSFLNSRGIEHPGGDMFSILIYVFMTVLFCGLAYVLIFKSHKQDVIVNKK